MSSALKPITNGPYVLIMFFRFAVLLLVIRVQFVILQQRVCQSAG